MELSSGKESSQKDCRDESIKEMLEAYTMVPPSPYVLRKRKKARAKLAKRKSSRPDTGQPGKPV